MNQIMFYGGIAGAIIFGVIAVILFIYFHIYTVIGDITGLNAKRSIAKLRQERYGEGTSKGEALPVATGEIHARRGKTTSKLPQTKSGALKVTRKLPRKGNETTLLKGPSQNAYQANETTLLVENQTGFAFEIVQSEQIIHTAERI